MNDSSDESVSTVESSASSKEGSILGSSSSIVSSLVNHIFGCIKSVVDSDDDWMHIHPHQSSDLTTVFCELPVFDASIQFHSFVFVVPILFCASIIFIYVSWLYFCSCEWIKLDT